MNTIELYVRGKRHRFTGPSCWSELTAGQAVAVMRLRSMASSTEKIFPFLTLLYGMKPRHLRWLFDDNLLRRQGISDDDRSRILEQGQVLLEELAFLNRADNEATFHVRAFRLHDFKFGTPRILLKRWLGRRVIYLAPDDAMGNCSFAEFIVADMAYRAGDWPKLAAVLYRPRAGVPTPADARLPFDDHLASAQARAFAELHPALLATVRHSYECTLIYLQSCFDRVFPEKSASSKPASGGNWLDVALGMAGLDVTKIRDIEQVNVYLALKTLNTKIRQADELDEHLDSLKTK